jgi:hypothetical protein
VARRLAELAEKAAGAYGRPDLAERAGAMVRRVDAPFLPVLVVGEFKSGKSSLVNALLGADVCPVDDDIATSVPVVVSAGDVPMAEVVHEPPGGAAPPAADPTVPVGAGAQANTVVEVSEIAEWVTEGGNPGNERRVARVEVTMPHKVLAAGLAFVDTPGVGGLGSLHNTATISALPFAEAVLFVTDSAQELTDAEVRFLRHVVRLCPQVLVVATKIDMQPQWREIAAIDLGHLHAAGLELPQVAVSAALRRHAIAGGGARANAESGVPDLLTWLGRQVKARSDRRTAGAVAGGVVDICDQLRAGFDAERAALVHPEHLPRLVADLEGAQQRAQALRGAQGAWARLMADAFADVQSDLDHDLRARLRDVTAAAESSIDEIDPADGWDELERWLRERTAGEVSGHYEELVGRMNDVLERVAVAFGDDADAVLAGFEAIAPGAGDGKAGTVSVSVEHPSLVSQTLSLLRSSYGAVAMFGFFGNLAGIALATPAMLVVGIVLGGKALREERTRQLAQRRAQGKAAVRRYLDEISFAVTKESRDGLRLAQRQLRDHLTDRAAELDRTASSALVSARAATEVEAGERTTRLAQIDAELDRLTRLRAKAADLVEEVGS